jgi:hypothetical protein
VGGCSVAAPLGSGMRVCDFYLARERIAQHLICLAALPADTAMVYSLYW